jgi:hypothetical protein
MVGVPSPSGTTEKYSNSLLFQAKKSLSINRIAEKNICVYVTATS